MYYVCWLTFTEYLAEWWAETNGELSLSRFTKWTNIENENEQQYQKSNRRGIVHEFAILGWKNILLLEKNFLILF